MASGLYGASAFELVPNHSHRSPGHHISTICSRSLPRTQPMVTTGYGIQHRHQPKPYRLNFGKWPHDPSQSMNLTLTVADYSLLYRPHPHRGRQSILTYHHGLNTPALRLYSDKDNQLIVAQPTIALRAHFSGPDRPQRSQQTTSLPYLRLSRHQLPLKPLPATATKTLLRAGTVDPGTSPTASETLTRLSADLPVWR